MQMIYCPNCEKLTGFKRVLGFGTFFMVLLTSGLWLLVIPFYPERCITCGLTRHSAVVHNFLDWYRGLSRGAKVCLLILPVLLLVGLGIFNSPSGVRRDSAMAYIDNSPSVTNANNRAPTAAHQIYTVAQINAHMNNIPTGTELAVRGFYVSPHVSGGWAPPNQLDPCSVLLYGGTVRVQHGEADPRDYCRFSVVLQDANTNQIQYLECAMSLEGAQAAKSQYSYKSLVQAYGTYASSLDFHLMPAFLGQRVGVPVLDDCALEPSSPLPVPTVPAPIAGRPAPPASSTPENILNAINAEDSTPENQSKPYPVDGDLEGDVRRALSTSMALKSAVITPVSLHREVTLSGTVVNEPSRELAEEITSQVPGVVAVHNNLTVRGGTNPQ
jgi:hypothetical protein